MNISYKATTEDVHIYIENLYPKEDRPPTRIMDQIEWSQLLGMQTGAVEGDIDSLDLASALDFTHIGLYPDATKEWHEANQIKIGKEHWPKLQNIWLQIEAIMILRPNLMQNILKHNLNEFEKRLYEDYPKTKSEENDQAEKQSRWYKEWQQLQHSYLITNDQVARTCFDQDTTNKRDEADPQPTQQPHTKVPCQGIVCKYKHWTNEKDLIKKVALASAKCNTCANFNHSVHLAQEFECDLLLDEEM